MVINGRSERELSLKIYLTSLVSKDLEFGFEREEIKDTFKDMSSDEISEKKKPATMVIEEEALRYIGCYIVKTNSAKYPHLGHKASVCVNGKTGMDRKFLLMSCFLVNCIVRRV